MVFLTATPPLFAINVIIINRAAVDIERLCRLAGVDARTAAREKARKEKSKAKKREEKEKERHARMEKTLESMKNNPHSWIPRWG